MELFRLHALNYWSKYGRGKAIKDKGKQHEQEEKVFIIDSLLRVNLASFLCRAWWQMNTLLLSALYTIFFTWKRNRMFTSSNLHRHQQNTFNFLKDAIVFVPYISKVSFRSKTWISLPLLEVWFCVKHRDASNKNPAERRFFWFLSLIPCSNPPIQSPIFTGSLCKPLQHAKAAESNTGKLADFMPC